MDFVKIKPEDFETLAELQKAYKAEIGEAAPADAELESLKQAIGAGRIQFYGCLCGGALVACCFCLRDLLDLPLRQVRRAGGFLYPAGAPP